ncbi:hypothetical protein BDP67DRAFT_426100 [Colletotrichum lupini]|nr:hypothetical protein BDP67DRAFT_426100 [Colletotrichum lupini]
MEFTHHCRCRAKSTAMRQPRPSHASPHKLNRKCLRQGYTSNNTSSFNHTIVLHLRLNYKNNVTQVHRKKHTLRDEHPSAYPHPPHRTLYPAASHLGTIPALKNSSIPIALTKLHPAAVRTTIPANNVNHNHHRRAHAALLQGLRRVFPLPDAPDAAGTGPGLGARQRR